MGIHKQPLDQVMGLRNSLKQQTKDKDVDKIDYLFFERLFSIEEIEHYYKGKYTYNEVKKIIREIRQNYYDKENKNGR